MKQLVWCVRSASMMVGNLMAQVEPGAGKWKAWVISSDGMQVGPQIAARALTDGAD
jgi:hypothetical protein